MSNDNKSRNAPAWLRELARRAIDTGGELLGMYRTEEGEIPVYLTTEKPRNMTEHAHELRIPPPSKL